MQRIPPRLECVRFVSYFFVRAGAALKLQGFCNFESNRGDESMFQDEDIGPYSLILKVHPEKVPGYDV